MLLGLSFHSVWLLGKVEKVMENISFNILFVILKIGMFRSILWSRLDSFLTLSLAEIVLYGVPNCGKSDMQDFVLIVFLCYQTED